MRWDIFCRVIDNYGDAGVCWRLAANLDAVGEQVTLWIDQPDILRWLIDQAHRKDRVSIRSWPDQAMTFASGEVADVVIEAFACEPPANYVAAMAARAINAQPPAWINLEYLSAEDWVEAHHRLPSPHPQYPLVKYFYFPGFTAHSGGLLRESDLPEPEPVFEGKDGSVAARQPLRIFLFGYEQPALQAWLQAQHSAMISVAPCPLADQLSRTSDTRPEGCQLERLPFVPQSDFDAVLRQHDLLFVRGEDSFVRAQWTGKPVFWQIYPQDADAHIVKLRAFYTRYLDPAILDQAERDSFLGFILAWNGSGNPDACGSLWPDILKMLPKLQQNALVWRECLLKQPDLVAQLRAFVADLVK